jgi:CBS-domain-containing membrane protein
LRVQDVMNRDYPSIYADELATKARAALRDLSLRILPVVDMHKRILGTISRSDIMAVSSSVSAVRVKGIMSKLGFVATPEMDVIGAVRQMLRLDEWYVPVAKTLQDNSYAGMLGLENVMRALYERKVAGLSTKLSVIMSTKHLLVCSPSDETDNVWRKMKQQSFAACPVLEKDRLVGFVSQQDLLESGATFPTFEGEKGRFKSPGTISKHMKTPAASLKSSNTVGDAAKLMLDRNIGRVPVVDNKGSLVGIVDREDVLRALIK